MKPKSTDIFRPIEEIKDFVDETKYFCNHVSFSPEEDSIDFWDKPHTYPPSFIEITEIDDFNNVYYFEIPKIVAYYAKTHPRYTYKGIEDHKNQGEWQFKNKLKRMLDIE